MKKIQNLVAEVRRLQIHFSSIETHLSDVDTQIDMQTSMLAAILHHVQAPVADLPDNGTTTSADVLPPGEHS